MHADGSVYGVHVSCISYKYARFTRTGTVLVRPITGITQTKDTGGP